MSFGTIWTIGHSNLKIDLLTGILKQHQIQNVADIRRYPFSRHNPQFNREELRKSLANEGISYVHFENLGGRRKPAKNSPHTAWRNLSFRGYADYMDTPEFKQAIDQLLQLTRKARTALMCAEALWWRCHRVLIADYLKAAGIEVIHIMPDGSGVSHRFTSIARIVNGKPVYQ